MGTVIASFRLWVVTALCMSALTPVVAAQPAHPAQAEAIRAIIDVPNPQSSPGCVAGIVQNGKTVSLQASGAADIATHRPLDPDTLLYAASVSKQFTAILIATLVEQKKITLDDDIRKWLPELPAYETPVTVRMLLHHTSGIRDSLDLLRLSGVLSFSKVPRKSALQLLYRQSNTNFRPGTQYKYSNGGYLLLSEIVERAAGMPFARFGQQTIFGPLGMKHSFFLADAPPTVANVAHGYPRAGGGHRGLPGGNELHRAEHRASEGGREPRGGRVCEVGEGEAGRTGEREEAADRARGGGVYGQDAVPEPGECFTVCLYARTEFLHLGAVELTGSKPSQLIDLDLREVSYMRLCVGLGTLTDVVEGGESPLMSKRSWRNTRRRWMGIRTGSTREMLSRP